MNDPTETPTFRDIILVDPRVIRTDYSYQVPIEERKFIKDFKEWDKDLADPVHLSRREDGSLWVMEGNRRREGAIRHNIPLIQGFVYDGLTVPEEAKIFGRLNTQRRALRKIDQFRAAVRGQDPTSVAINQIIEEVGLSIGNKGASLGRFTAVKAAEEVAQWAGLEVLRDAMTILVNAYGLDSRDPVPGGILKGVGVLLTHPGVDHERLEQVLARDTPQRLTLHAKNRHSRPIRGMVGELVDRYNRRLSNARRLRPEDVTFPKGA